MKTREILFVLNRIRVGKLLKKIHRGPLSIVSAKSGYGKTIAVKNFMSRSQGNSIWVSMYNGLTSGYYFQYICDQIEEIDHELFEKLMRVGLLKDDVDTMAIMDIFSKHVIKDKLILVFDDFHTIDDLILLQLIKRLVRLNIENLHIVVITRETSFKLFSDVLTLCEIISGDDLMFTVSEVQELSKKFALKISSEQAQDILEYSKGWASVVFLLLKGLSNGICIDHNQTVDILIKNTMFDVLEDVDRRILMNLCFLEKFLVDEAIYVTGDPECANRLYQLSASVPFIQCSGDSFAIHSIYADFLKQEAYKHAVDIQKNYVAAGQWRLKNDDYITAFKYYDLAGHIEQLFIDKNQLATMHFFNFPEFVYEIIRKCHDTMYVRYPFAFLDIGAQLFLSDRRPYQELGARIIITMHGMALENVYGEINELVLAETYVMNVFLAFNDPVKTAESIHNALDVFGERHSILINRHSPITFCSPNFIYLYFKEKGAFKAVSDFTKEHIVHFPKFTNGCGEGCDLVVDAEYLLEVGALQKAELAAYKAIHKTRIHEQVGLEICATFVVIRINVLRGNLKEVENMIYGLELLIANSREKLYETTLDMIKAYVYTTIGSVDKIPRWLLNLDRVDNEYRTIGMGFINIIRSKILILKEEFNILGVEVHIAHEAFTTYHNMLGYIHNSIHKAIIEIKSNNSKEGETVLYKALMLAKEDHIVMPFVENSMHLLDTLKGLAQAYRDDVYIRDLLEKCNKYCKNIKAMGYNNLLSKSEQGVLKMLEAGKSRKEIAESLNISINTVKTHLSKIYQKLDVKTKQRAIEKAQNLNILK